MKRANLVDSKPRSAYQSARGSRHLAPAQFDAAETRAIALKTPTGNFNFTGQSFLLRWALPNFYFHCATAYNLLRHNGVPVGKFDFLGSFTAGEKLLIRLRLDDHHRPAASQSQNLGRVLLGACDLEHLERIDQREQCTG